MKKNFYKDNFWRGYESGAVMILFALLLPIFFGFIALAIDVGIIYASHGRIQDEADAAALAGAAHLKDVDDDDGTRGDKIQEAIKIYMEFNDREKNKVAVVYAPNEVTKYAKSEKGEDIIEMELSDASGAGNATTIVKWGVVKPKDKDVERVRVVVTQNVPVIFANAVDTIGVLKNGINVDAVAAAEGKAKAEADEDGGMSIITRRVDGDLDFMGESGTCIFNADDVMSNGDPVNAGRYTRGVASKGLGGNKQEATGIFFHPDGGSINSTFIYEVNSQTKVFDTRQPCRVRGDDGAWTLKLASNDITYSNSDVQIITDWANIKDNPDDPYHAPVLPYYKDLTERSQLIEDDAAAQAKEGFVTYKNTIAPLLEQYKSIEQLYAQYQQIESNKQYADPNADWGKKRLAELEVEAADAKAKYDAAVAQVASSGLKSFEHTGTNGTNIAKYYKDESKGTLDLYVFIPNNGHYDSNLGDVAWGSYLDNDAISKMGLSGQKIDRLFFPTIDGTANIATTGVTYGNVYILPKSDAGFESSPTQAAILGDDNVFRGHIFSNAKVDIKCNRAYFARILTKDIFFHNRGGSKYYFLPAGSVGKPTTDPSAPRKLRLVE